MILDATNRSLALVLGSAHTTTAPVFNVSYANYTASTFTGGASSGVANGTTPVEILSAPAASAYRQAKYINVANVDTVSHTVTISYVDGATTRRLVNETLAAGDELEWSQDTGWRKTFANGTGAVFSVFGRTGAVVAATSDYDASQIDNTPAGTIAATDVQAAINELDAEKASYEQGSWTPVPRGSTTAGSPTGTFAGRYIKVGNLVFISCQIVFTGLSTMAGNFEVIGLPFNVETGSVNRSAISVGFRNNFTNDFVVGAYILENSATIRIQRMDMDGTSVAIGDISASTNLYFTAIYRTA
jgi:hypothetical protein